MRIKYVMNMEKKIKILFNKFNKLFKLLEIAFSSYN